MAQRTSTLNTSITIDLIVAYRWLTRYWFECLAVGLILYLLPIEQKEFQFRIGGYLASPVQVSTASIIDYQADNNAVDQLDEGKPLNISMIRPVASPAARPGATVYGDASAPDFGDVSPLSDDPAPHISNLTLVLSPDYAERKGLSEEIVRAKWARVRHYIQTYVQDAQQEMRDYGIPASITLAQGLLESNAGDSRLAQESNNHFGIKCKSKCRGCTCRNYRDDSAYDMFRVFANPRDSYREHSILLSGQRYAKLKDYGMDYKKWAHGLKKAGYATDKRYAHKLIKIVEGLGLQAYDQQP